MHRILKPGGTMAVWPPSWVHRSISRSGIFAYSGTSRGVMNYLAGCASHTPPCFRSRRRALGAAASPGLHLWRLVHADAVAL
jgi:hypothetical protein